MLITQLANFTKGNQSDPEFRHQFFELLPILAVLAVFFVGMLLVGQNPYPVYDDWSYCWSVKQVLATGKLQYLATFATAIPVIAVGALCSCIFGFSYLLMHNISALSSVVAALGLYHAVRELDASRTLASIAAGTLLFNPILVNLGFACMTDPPALAFITWSFWAIFRIVKKPEDSTWSVLALIMFLSLGTLTRQSFVIMLPGIAACAIVFFRQYRRTSLLLFSGSVLQLLLCKIADEYLMGNVKYPQDTLRVKAGISNALQHWLYQPADFPRDALFESAKVMAYIGAFCLPILIWKICEVVKCCYPATVSKLANFNKSAAWWSFLFALLTVAGPLTYLWCIEAEWMPYFFVFWDFPRVGCYYRLTPPAFSSMTTQYWTFACCILGTFCTWATSYSIASGIYLAKHKKDQSLFLTIVFSFLFLAGMLFCAILQGKTFNYDRYLIPLVVPIITLFFCNIHAAENSSRQKASADKIVDQIHCSTADTSANKLIAWVATGAVLIMAIYSFVAALDFVNFQAARWKAAAHMEKLGTPIDELDVGPDYIFTKLPDTYAFCNPPTEMHSFNNNAMAGAPPLGPLRGCPVLNEKFVLNPDYDSILFRGYVPVFRQPYWSPWNGRNMEILVLEKRK